MRKKLTQREFRPRYILYIPIYIYYLWLSTKSGSLMFPYLANPGMPPVSVMQFSKRHLLKQLPEQYLPKTYLIDKQTEGEQIDVYLAELGFPCIIKPDIGERGNGVAVIRSAEQLYTYMHQAESDQTYLLQEFCDYPLEFGVMWYRLPGEDSGHISGIVGKEPCVVIGDGEHTLQELVSQNERTARYTSIFARNNAARWRSVIPQGEKVQLTYIANHNKGTVFLDKSSYISERMINTLDEITSHLEGFWYGRLDIKAPSIDDLTNGEQIKIIEINGIQSEPAHIYDPTYPLRKGYQQLFHHRSMLYQIAKRNHSLGYSYQLFGSIRKHVFPDKAQLPSGEIHIDQRKPTE